MRRVLSLAALSLVLLLPSGLFAMLHPVHNRFLQRDPIGYSDSGSLYEGLKSDPVQHVDPKGLYTLINARFSTGYKEQPGNRDKYSVKYDDNYYPKIESCPCCCAFVWIHGFQNSQAEAEDGAKQIEKSYLRGLGKSFQKDKCDVYGFTWNSNPGVLSFGAAQQAASQVGTGAFARFIKDFKTKCPNKKLFLGGHSLGSQVILEAMANGGVTGIDHVFLVSAAVPNTSLAAPKNPYFDYRKALGGAMKITIAYNNDDSVLKYAYGPDVGLGSSGWQGGPLPSNVTQQDYTGETQWGSDHSAIYKDIGLGFWIRNARAISCSAAGGATK